MSPFAEYASRIVTFVNEYVPRSVYAASEIATGTAVPPRFSSLRVSASEAPAARVRGYASARTPRYAPATRVAGDARMPPEPVARRTLSATSRNPEPCTSASYERSLAPDRRYSVIRSAVTPLPAACQTRAAAPAAIAAATSVPVIGLVVTAVVPSPGADCNGMSAIAVPIATMSGFGLPIAVGPRADGIAGSR